MYSTSTFPLNTTTPALEGPDFKQLSPVNITLAVYILIQNSMIVYHYRKDWKKISALLFILIAVVDIGTACSELGKGSVALLCLKNENLRLPQWTYLTCISFSIACYVTSTFLAVVLAVVKTFKIVNPFYNLRESVLKIVLIVILSVNLVLFISDTWSWNDLIHDAVNPHPKCSALWGFWKVLGNTNYLGQGSAFNILLKYFREELDAVHTALEISFPFIQFIIPCLIVFVCMIIQMVYIKRSIGNGESPMHNDANHANITVFLISMLYLVSVGTFSVYLLMIMLNSYLSGGNFYAGPVYFIVRFTLPLLNAALFPTILITRKPDLMAKYLGYIEAVCCLPRNVFRRVRQEVYRKDGYTEIRGSDDG